jgi:hypothetical protein
VVQGIDGHLIKHISRSYAQQFPRSLLPFNIEVVDCQAAKVIKRTRDNIKMIGDQSVRMI